MSKTWILVANASVAKLFETHRARLFNANGSAREELKLIKKFYHEESRYKNADLLSDSFGKFHGGGSSSGSFHKHINAKDEEAQRFARLLMHELDSARKNHEYDDVVIVSNPHFQGMLREHIASPLRRCVSNYIEKDYTHIPIQKLATHLQTMI